MAAWPAFHRLPLAGLLAACVFLGACVLPLRMAPAVQGRVVDSASGEPLPHFDRDEVARVLDDLKSVKSGDVD